MTKAEQLQKVWHKYDNRKHHKPTSAREAAEWAVAEGLLELPEVDPYDVLERDRCHRLSGMSSRRIRKDADTASIMPCASPRAAYRAHSGE
jgi:hypothetical protein